MATQGPTRRQLEVLWAYIAGRLSVGCGLRAGHQRDDGAAAPLGAVPRDRVSERGAGCVLAGRWGKGHAGEPCRGMAGPSR